MRLENPATQCTGQVRKTSLIRRVLILIAGLTIFSIAAMLAVFFLFNNNDAAKEVNINVTTPPTAPFSPDTPIIRRAPPLPTQRPVGQTSVPPAPSVATPGGDMNGQPTPKWTPQLTPSASPP